MVDGPPERDDDDNVKAQDIPVAAKIAGPALIALAVIVAGGTVILLNRDPEANTPEFELLKACLSVIVIAFGGGLATFAFGILQKERDRRQDVAQRDSDRRQDVAQRDSDRRQDEARRDVEIRIDERRRQDEQVSVILNDTLEHWLAVKRIRRELEAATYTGSGASITLDDYDRYLHELNKQQLAFERLTKIAPLLKKIPHLSEPDSLEHLLRRIEDFLNDVVDEYQRSRYVVAKAGKIDLADLAKHTNALPTRIRRPPGGKAPEQRTTLHDFIYQTGKFRRRTTENVGLVVLRLEQALLEPLDLSARPDSKTENEDTSAVRPPRTP
jgi:hypothetical protein